MAAARVAQSVVQVIVAPVATARVAQSVVQIILIPGPAPVVATPLQQTQVGGGCFGEVKCADTPLPPLAKVRIPKKRPADQSMMQAVFFRHGRS